MPSTACCNDPSVDFKLGFTVPGSPRVPADGAPIEAYFDNITVAGPGFEMDHPLTKPPIMLAPGGTPDSPDQPVLAPIDEAGEVFHLADEDLCDKPQLAFAIGAVLSGS